MLRRMICTRATRRLSASPSWIPRSTESLQRAAMTQVLHDFTQQQLRTAEKLVPWFLENMPESYFRQVSEEDRLEHLKAIAALYDPNSSKKQQQQQQHHRRLDSEEENNSNSNNTELRVVTHKPGQRLVTFVRLGDGPGSLLRQVQQLTRSTEEGSLRQLKVFTAKDKSLCLNAYTFATKEEEEEEQEEAAVGEDSTASLDGSRPHLEFAEAQRLRVPEDDFWSHEGVARHVARCSSHYVESTRPRRWAKQRELYEQVRSTENVASYREPGCGGETSASSWIVVCAPNTLPFSYLQKMLRMLKGAGLDLQRCHLDVLQEKGGYEATMLRALVRPLTENTDWAAVDYLCKRLKWLDDAALDFLFDEESDFSVEAVQRAEALTALTSLAHRGLGKVDALAYSLAAVRQTVKRPKYLEISQEAAAELSLVGSSSNNDEKEARKEALMAKVVMATGVDSTAHRLLAKMVDLAFGCTASNMHLADRYALALQLAIKQTSEEPCAVVFVHGRRFDAFHIRFRHLARGGLRLVTARSREALGVESMRHYEECYNLARAQQLKNKDIPEGGSKGVILIDATPPPEWSGEFHDYICRKSVKACTDSLLDLMLLDEEAELLYLGPDEQVVPRDINWVVANARRRGHPVPDAFMSSKPDAGINHKEFGVTSEGVHVFLEAALRASGVDPSTDSFTVKLTGGPDGDVAGNALKILMRECPLAQVVGIADATGCAEDPAGLCTTELARLVDQGKPIAEFDPKRLSTDGAVWLAGRDSVRGTAMRDSMHNRVKSDVFIPAGGRPGTINASNWRQFLLDEQNQPSSPIIVEGANLFVTAEARKLLHSEAGVRIVKDSSANKGGVVCSSFEILAAHVLPAGEFERDKEIIVEQILKRLRALAKLEADLLFYEYATFPGALPDFSERISKQINDVTDAVVESLKDDDEAAVELFRHLAPDHLPPILAAAALSNLDRLPKGYLQAAVGSFIASRLVYSEGVHFVESMPRGPRLANLGLQFFKSQQHTDQAIEQLEARFFDDDESGLKADVIGLLRKGGARAGLDLVSETQTQPIQINNAS